MIEFRKPIMYYKITIFKVVKKLIYFFKVINFLVSVIFNELSYYKNHIRLGIILY